MRTCFNFRIAHRVFVFSFTLLAVFGPSFVFADSNSSEQKSVVELISKAVQENHILYRLTTLDEFKTLIGPAKKEKTRNDGGMEIIELEYPNVHVFFGKMRRDSTPLTLRLINVKGRQLDIGQERQVVLRNEEDLKKIGSFWGFANISLANLDLRNHLQLLEKMPFDSRTEWPAPDMLPDGFEPAQLLEDGKNPGLGVRDLHKQGIDGRGITIAILDQPLLKNHQEYAGKIIKYEGIDVQGMTPKMHSAPIVSIVVGEYCGVAPAARVYYYAMRGTSMPDNKIYCDIIDGIIKSNKSASTSDRIRVVSISTGMFAHQDNFDLWKETLAKANKNGILVVTCAQDSILHGMLARIDGKDPDDPASYVSGIYGVQPGAVLVPASNRTTAGHTGPDVYTFWREAGMSWATPYLAGLAALGYQINPEIKPKKIVNLLQETAVQTNVGEVVQPKAFIEAVRKSKR